MEALTPLPSGKQLHVSSYKKPYLLYFFPGYQMHEPRIPLQNDFLTKHIFHYCQKK